MIDWGLPDWRDAASYGDTTLWGDHRWRWEFLRRCRLLRIAFHRNARLAVRRRAADEIIQGVQLPTLLPTDPQFTTNPFGGEPFGYIGLPNPAISELSEAFLKFITASQPQSGLHTYYDGEGNPAYSDGVFFSPDEAVWVFDLTGDIDAQVNAAKEKIKALQADRQLVPRQPKFHRKNWPLYLRVLDAREGGASLSDIAQILPEQFGRRDPQTAHNVVKQARTLQFSLSKISIP